MKAEFPKVPNVPSNVPHKYDSFDKFKHNFDVSKNIKRQKKFSMY